MCVCVFGGGGGEGGGGAYISLMLGSCSSLSACSNKSVGSLALLMSLYFVVFKTLELFKLLRNF